MPTTEAYLHCGMADRRGVMSMGEPLRMVPSAVVTEADRERLLRLDQELADDPGEIAWREWIDDAVQTGRYFGGRS